MASESNPKPMAKTPRSSPDRGNSKSSINMLNTFFKGPKKGKGKSGTPPDQGDDLLRQHESQLRTLQQGLEEQHRQTLEGLLTSVHQKRRRQFKTSPGNSSHQQQMSSQSAGEQSTNSDTTTIQIGEVSNKTSNTLSTAPSWESAASSANNTSNSNTAKSLQEELIEQMQEWSLELELERKKQTESQQSLKNLHQTEMANLTKQKEEEIERMRKEHQDKLTKLRTQMETESAERYTAQEGEWMEKLATVCTGIKNQNQDKISQLKQDFQREKAQLQRDSSEQLRQLRDEHTSNIDEVMQQLDGVEAEHLSTLRQKDAIIGALGAQLGDASNLRTDLESQLQHAQNQIERLMEAKRQTDTFVEDIQRQHLVAIKEEERKRTEACEVTRKEMIAEAEKQFAKANQTYLALQRTYEQSANDNQALEKELLNLQTEVEAIQKAQQAEQIEHATQLAALRGNLASTESEMARQIRIHAEDLAKLQGEKQSLAKENEELKNICEELMGIVENKDGKGNE